MKIGEKLQPLKPYAGGAVIGIAVAAVVAFSADMIVTTGTMTQQVRAAQTEVLAKVCQQNAAAHWQSQGNQAAELDGWRNEERTKLAERFAPDVVDAAGRKAVVDSCNDMLRPA